MIQLKNEYFVNRWAACYSANDQLKNTREQSEDSLLSVGCVWNDILFYNVFLNSSAENSKLSNAYLQIKAVYKHANLHDRYHFLYKQRIKDRLCLMTSNKPLIVWCGTVWSVLRNYVNLKILILITYCRKLLRCYFWESSIASKHDILNWEFKDLLKAISEKFPVSCESSLFHFYKNCVTNFFF